MRNYKLSFADYEQILKLMKGKEVTIYAGIEPRVLVEYDICDNLNYEIKDKRLIIFDCKYPDVKELRDFEIHIPNVHEIIEMTLDHNHDDDKNLMCMELYVKTNDGYFITVSEYCGQDAIIKVGNKWSYKKLENVLGGIK